MAARAWLAHTLPWVIVLFLVALFQVMRGAWVDAAIFVAILLLAMMPAARTSGGELEAATRRRSASRGVLIPLAVGIGVALFVAPRHGVVAGIVLATLGLVIAVLAWCGRPATSAAPRRAVATAVGAWIAVIAVAGLWEASSYLLVRWASVPDRAMPAISELVDPLLDTPVGKALFLLLWLAAGVVLVRRLRRAPWGGSRWVSMPCAALPP